MCSDSIKKRSLSNQDTSHTPDSLTTASINHSTKNLKQASEYNPEKEFNMFIHHNDKDNEQGAMDRNEFDDIMPQNSDSNKEKDTRPVPDEANDSNKEENTPSDHNDTSSNDHIDTTVGLNIHSSTETTLSNNPSHEKGMDSTVELSINSSTENTLHNDHYHNDSSLVTSSNMAVPESIMTSSNNNDDPAHMTSYKMAASTTTTSLTSTNGVTRAPAVSTRNSDLAPSLATNALDPAGRGPRVRDPVATCDYLRYMR